MFSLLVTIISIALVAALALATLYYGGRAYTNAAAAAQTTKILAQGQQLVAAAQLFRANTGAWPDTLPDLVNSEHLRSIPLAQVAVSEALADGTPWEMPVNGLPVFVLDTSMPEACRGVNENGYGLRGILSSLDTSVAVQCFGADLGELVTVVTANPQMLVQAAAHPSAPAFLADAVQAAHPTDPEDAAWLVKPGADPIRGEGTSPDEGGEPPLPAELTLGSYSLTPATRGEAYSAFDFAQLLTIDNVDTPNPSQVTWSISGGSLPAGMSLSAAGQLQGTPSEEGSFNFTVTAGYNGESGSQSYLLTVAAPLWDTVQIDPSLVFAPTSGLSSLGAGNATVSPDGYTVTFNGRGAGSGQGQALGAFTEPSLVGGRQYLEFTFTAASSALVTVRTSLASDVSGIYVYGNSCLTSGAGATCTNTYGASAGVRLGVLLDYDAGKITFTRAGVVAHEAPLASAPYRIRMIDADSPIDPNTRTVTIHPQPSNWLFAPANVTPIRAS